MNNKNLAFELPINNFMLFRRKKKKKKKLMCI